jgi:Prion-inhibition and propagation
MAGIGEAIGAIGLIEPFLHACLRSYGLYKLTRDFGEDYHKAERRLQGQRARLKVLSETETRSIVAIPEDGTILGATVVSTLQGMKTSFEKCETLMRKYGSMTSNP